MTDKLFAQEARKYGFKSGFRLQKAQNSSDRKSTFWMKKVFHSKTAQDKLKEKCLFERSSPKISDCKSTNSFSAPVTVSISGPIRVGSIRAPMCRCRHCVSISCSIHFFNQGVLDISQSSFDRPPTWSFDAQPLSRPKSLSASSHCTILSMLGLQGRHEQRSSRDQWLGG